MTFATLNRAFPLVLAIHNLEELRRYDDFASGFSLPRFPGRRDRATMRAAALVLTAIAVINSGVTYLVDGSTELLISEIATFALAVNALVHCALSFLRRRVVPGTLSAALVVLPYTAIAIVVMRHDHRVPMGAPGQTALTAVIALVVAVVSAWWVGRAIVALVHRRQGR